MYINVYYNILLRISDFYGLFQILARLSSWVMVEDCSGECADDKGVKKMVRECLRGSADSDGCNCAEVDGDVVCSGHNEADEEVNDGRGLVWFEPCNRDRCRKFL